MEMKNWLKNIGVGMVKNQKLALNQEGINGIN